MENFEVLNKEEIKHFIDKNQSFINKYNYLFNPDVNYKLTPKSLIIYDFINCFFEIKNYIPDDILKKFLKSLNKVRTEIKKEKRNDAIPKINFLNKLFTISGEKILMKVVKETKLYVFFKYAEEETYEPHDSYGLGQRVLIIDGEIQWEQYVHKEKKQDIINKINEVQLEDVPNLKYNFYFD